MGCYSCQVENNNGLGCNSKNGLLENITDVEVEQGDD